MSNVRYDAEVNVRTKSGELVTVYPIVNGSAGMSAAQIHTAARKAGESMVRGGKAVGSAVNAKGY